MSPNHYTIAELGQILKAQRGQHELTQQELADRMDVSRQSIARAEAGQQNHRKLIIRTLRELGVEVTGPFYRVPPDVTPNPPSESA